MKSISELVKLVNGLPWACTGASTYTNSPRNLRPTARKNPPAVWFLCLSYPDFCHRLKAWGSILADFSPSCCWCCQAGRPADPHWQAGRGLQQQMKKYAGQSELVAANQTFPRHLIEYFSTRWNGGCEGGSSSPIPTFLLSAIDSFSMFLFLKAIWGLVRVFDWAQFSWGQSFVTFQSCQKYSGCLAEVGFKLF